MISKTIFKKAFIVLLLTGIVNWFSVKLYLYWTVWWADNIAHFLGGMFVVLSVLWLCSLLPDFKTWTSKKIFIISIVGVILVGFFWEVFEIFIEATYLSDGKDYWTDTTSDIIMDTLGGILGFLYVNRLVNKS